jgi:3-phenylpropionate/cinnamic acid dioxygenase small subunit
MSAMRAGAISRDLQQEIEQFLYDEAELLDDGQFCEWLDLFTDDARYWMPVRETLQGRRDGLHPEDAPAVSLIDDDKTFLTMRVRRLDTGLAHAETPPSRTRRFIGNVRIREQADGELLVRSNFQIYQARQEQTDYQFFGQREDRLRKVAGQWRIAQRKIVLDHTVLPRALSTFF